MFVGDGMTFLYTNITLSPPKCYSSVKYGVPVVKNKTKNKLVEGKYTTPKSSPRCVITPLRYI